MAVELYDDIEQSERVKNWLRENGAGILIGLLLAFGGIFGYRYWQEHQLSRNLSAASQYYLLLQQITAAAENGNDTAPQQVSAAQILRQMQEQNPDNLYTSLAALRVADQHLADNSLEEALARYDFVIERNSGQGVANIARLRKARTLVGLGQADQALQTLDEIQPREHYAPLIARVRGQAYLQQGDTANARAAFEQVASELGGAPDPYVDLQLQQLAALEPEELLDEASPAPSGAAADQPLLQNVPVPDDDAGSGQPRAADQADGNGGGGGR